MGKFQISQIKSDNFIENFWKIVEKKLFENHFLAEVLKIRKEIWE